MTRPLGPGTENRAINWSLEEGQIWRRLAFQRGTSVNQAVQELAVRALRDIEPALAEEIERIRKARGLAVRLAKETSKAAVTLAIIASVLVVGSDVRRCARSLRVRRNEYSMELVG